MSTDTLAATAAVLLSLLFSYVPGFQSWFEPLNATYKRLIMLFLLVLVAGGAFALACARLGEVAVTCDQPGAWGLLRALIAAMVANQATYALSPKKGTNAAPNSSELGRLWKG